MRKKLLAFALLALSIGSEAQAQQPEATKQIALSSWGASVAYDDLKVTDINGEVILSEDFSTKSKLWKAGKTWVCENGWLVQKDSYAQEEMCTFKTPVGSQYDVYVKAKILATASHGIIIFFDKVSKSKWKKIDLFGGYGGCGLTRTFWKDKAKYLSGAGQWLGEYIREGLTSTGKSLNKQQVYDIHLSVRDGGVCCFLDDKVLLAYSYSSEEKDHVESWLKGKTENFPFQFLAQFRGKDWTRQTMRDTYKYTYDYQDSNIQAMLEAAEEGDVEAKKKLAICLWHGINTPQNKQDAVMWMRMIDNPDNELQDYLIMAKGEGLYDREIPEKWYEHNHSDVLAQAAKEGNPEAIRAKNANAEIRQKEESAFMGLARLFGALGAGEKPKKMVSLSDNEYRTITTSPSWHAPKPERGLPLPSEQVDIYWKEGGEFIIGTLFYDKQKKRHYITNVNERLLGKDLYYRTAQDLLDALYAYKKYNVTRKVGLIE